MGGEAMTKLDKVIALFILAVTGAATWWFLKFALPAFMAGAGIKIP